MPGVIDKLSETASKEKWDRIGFSRRAGVLAPLFSVYSRTSAGIGDLEDLKLLIDWAAMTGNSIVQLLPMNEVGPVFCPYDSVSSFALEPSYIALHKVPRGGLNPGAAAIRKMRQDFPCGRGYVDYRIKTEKLKALGGLFDEKDARSDGDLPAFIDENAYWIGDFALFKVLKDRHQGKPWYEWPDEYKYRDESALSRFSRDCRREILFQVWLQWVISVQFKEAASHARQKSVFIKGDMPILASRDSADVWAHPEYFKLDFAAGAPPDMYCAKGQRWGMPPYNWEKIARDGYRYLKEKLKYAQSFYDILRIDHVVGLLRIWSIPYNEPLENIGLNGFFDPPCESAWYEHGKRILSVMLENTRCLLCAEDLGIIPRACTQALEELGIPGNEVQRWVKDWNTRHDFLNPQEYRRLSVAMLSTHDTTNWPAWWENEAGTVDEALFVRKCSDRRNIGFERVKDRLFDPSRSRHGRLRWQESVNSAEALVSILGKAKDEAGDFIDLYLNTYEEKEKLWQHLKMPGQMREESSPEVVRRALKISLDSEAIFCINTIVDLLYLDDLFKGDPYQYRINTPGTISQDNWSLTIPLYLEELLGHKVNAEIKALAASSGRI